MAQRWGAHPSGPAGSKSPETIIHLTSPTVIPPSFILHRCFWNLACEGSQTSSQWPNPTYRYIQFDPLVFCFIFLFSMNLMPTLTIGSLHIKIPASPLKPKAVGWAHNGASGGQEPGGGCGGRRHSPTQIHSLLCPKLLS